MNPTTLLPPPRDAQRLRAHAKTLPGIALQSAELAALELLLQGAFAPLDGFTLEANAQRPALPLWLHEPPAGAAPDFMPARGDELALHDCEGVVLAILQIEEVRRAQDRTLLAGAVRGIELPTRELFAQARATPTGLRAIMAPSPAEESLCVHLRGEFDGEFDAASLARIRDFAARGAVLLRVLDDGNPDRAHLLKRALHGAMRACSQLGLRQELVCVSPDPCPVAMRQDPHGQRALDICFARNVGCAHNLWWQGAPAAQPGLCVFFTGLSGSGKSTLARALHAELVHTGERAVTLLDGDVVRRQLSKGLGFARADRDTNVLRIGFVASQIVLHGGAVICAPIAPYAHTREAVREMIEPYGRFVEIHVSTALDVCEARDRKGLYAKARAGVIKEFTGISDPYEVPSNPQLRIDTAHTPMPDAIAQVMALL